MLKNCFTVSVIAAALAGAVHGADYVTASGMPVKTGFGECVRTGYWSEATRNINGTLEGSGSNGEFSVLVTANGFAAELSMKVAGGKQTIVMSSKNTDLRGLNISMSKS